MVFTHDTMAEEDEEKEDEEEEKEEEGETDADAAEDKAGMSSFHILMVVSQEAETR